jgi:cardiolipin synthase
MVTVRLAAQRSFFSLGTRRNEASSKPGGGVPGRPETLSKVEKSNKATSLHEDIYTLPNLLTLSRLVAAPFIGYFVLHEEHALALGLFVYAGISDLVDGYIARRWNKETVVGTVIDPMADKTLMTILTVCLAVKGALPGTKANPPIIIPPPRSS